MEMEITTPGKQISRSGRGQILHRAWGAGVHLRRPSGGALVWLSAVSDNTCGHSSHFLMLGCHQQSDDRLRIVDFATSHHGQGLVEGERHDL